MGPASAAWSEREVVVMNALRIISHTGIVDEDFLKQCIFKVAETKAPPSGFGSMLEQHEGEFQKLLQHARGCRSALEIGSRYGKSIERIALEMQPGSRVVAVDMPYTGGVDVALPNAEPILRETMRLLGDRYDAHLFLGDSHSQEIVDAVKALGPFDFCFIDGDHSYEGAKADWENYGPLAKVVAFHDIINNVDCARLWREIRAKHRTVEYTESVWLGIGVVLKD